MLNCLDTTQKDALHVICSNPVIKVPGPRFDTFSECKDFHYRLLSVNWEQVMEIARSLDTRDERLTYTKRSYGASCIETGACLDVKHSKWFHLFQFGQEVYCAYFEDTEYSMTYIICK